MYCLAHGFSLRICFFTMRRYTGGWEEGHALCRKYCTNNPQMFFFGGPGLTWNELWKYRMVNESSGSDRLVVVAVKITCSEAVVSKAAVVCVCSQPWTVAEDWRSCSTPRRVGKMEKREGSEGCWWEKGVPTAGRWSPQDGDEASASVDSSSREASATLHTSETQVRRVNCGVINYQECTNDTRRSVQHFILLAIMFLCLCAYWCEFCF